MSDATSSPPLATTPAAYRIPTEKKVVLDWIFALYYGRVSISQVPVGALVTDLNCLGMLYGRTHAMVWGKIGWKWIPRGPVFTSEFEEMIPVRPPADF